MPLVRANRDKIDDRFSVLGFTIRTESPLYEVGVATDPALFRAENRPRRTRRNFFSSRSFGVLRARRGEAVYMVPPDVLAQFVGQPRLYFGLATYREGSGGVPDFVQSPSSGNMYVDLSGLTERGLRRLAARPGASYGGGGGNDPSLDWGGDAQPQTALPPAAASAPVKAAAPQAPVHAPYDDGFGDFPSHSHVATTPAPAAANQPASGSTAPTSAPTPAPAPSSAPAAQGLGWYGRALEEDDGDDGSCDGIPDSEALSLSLSATPDYPGASRFVPAHASNYRASSTPRTVDKIVIHITDGGRKIDGTIGWFQNGNQTTASGKVIHVSAHYVIGQDGEVVQMVRNNDIAWHAGSANRSSIGIEHVANTKGLVPTDAQYRASADLVAWLCGQYGLPLDRAHVLGHAEADSKTTHRACPNAVWDWGKYMGYVQTSGAAPRAKGLAYQAPGARPSRGLEVPLTPEDGAGVCIDVSALQPADIIVSTARHPVSYAIRAGTVSAISHAMLYVGNGKVIEAVGSGVREVPLSQAIDSAILAVAYRHPSVDAATAASIVSFARSKVGSPYNYSGVAYTGYRAINPVGAKIIQKIADVAGVSIGQAGALFCSELVFEAFDHAGLPLSATPASASTPDDIVQLSRGLLQYVGHLKGEDVFLGVALGLGLTGGSRALGGDSFSIHWPNVPYIAQVSDGSCWAAATAMLVSWRDNVSISDREVADRVGIANAYEQGLAPEERPTLARAWNLVAEAPASYGVDDFRRLLQRCGPLFLDMTNSRGEGGHAWILVGMTSEGAEDGSDTVMYLHNPTRSKGKVKWSFPEFLRFYQNRVDTSGGVLPCQVMHVAAVPAGRQTVAATQFAVGLAQECFSIHWPDVPYVEQSSNGSCWAAATAMVVGWRDSISISDQTIADQVGIEDAYEHGLWPKDRPVLARTWNLVDEPPASYPIGEFRRLLETYGPLFLDMTNSRGEKGHAWVLVGMTSDGAEDGSDTVMYLHNPTASRGKVKWKFPDFLKLYENRVNTSGGVLPCQILHARAIPAGKRPGTAAQFALGLATPRALENESFSIHWPNVPYLAQEEGGNSCWAAATAMVVSWRDGRNDLTDRKIAEGTPLPGAFDNGLEPKDRPVVAATWNLSSEAPASYGINDFRRMLERYGPLYLSLTNSREESGHAWVLVGMTSDGAEDGSDTTMYLHNPTASRGKVKWTFPAFLRLYERRVDTSGGVLPCQIMHAKAIPASRQPVNAAQFALGLAAYEPPLPRGATPPLHHFSAAALGGGDTVDYPVHLIPQPDKLSCWAASMAMLLSFRRNASISPETLANEVGSSLRTSYNWDLLNAVKAKYGFVTISQPSNASLYNSPSQWADWLRSHGPLWVVIVGMPHAVVISGIKGDFSDPAQCQVKILNPWDTRIDFNDDEVDFHPANHGYADWLPFNDFASDFGHMAAPNYGNWRVLHLPAASSQGLDYNGRTPARTRGLAAPPAPVRAMGTDVSSSSLSGEPIDPPRVPGTRMARQRGAKGRTTWALDQLEGVKQANPSPAVAAALVPTTLVLNDWPHLEQDPVPLPLSVSFESGGGGVGNVRISAGSAPELPYDVTVTATIEDEPRPAGDRAAIRVTVDVDFSNTSQGNFTARTLLKLYSNGSFDKDCRNL